MPFPEFELHVLERMKLDAFEVHEELNIINFGVVILNRIMKTYPQLPISDIFFNNSKSLKKIYLDFKWKSCLFLVATIFLYVPRFW